MEKKLIINGEICENNIPNFDSAAKILSNGLYDLVLFDNGREVLRFHDITKTDINNYQVDGGQIMVEIPINKRLDAIEDAIMDLAEVLNG